MDAQFSLVIFSCLLLLIKSSQDFLRCSVCRAMVDEMNLRINREDPEKKVSVGSFRIDSHGNQQQTEVPYGRSEHFLIETAEKICKDLSEYNKGTNIRGEESVIRTKTFAGESLSLEGQTFDLFFTQKINKICDNLLEDIEEDLVTIFRREDYPDIHTIICADIGKVCTGEQLNIPLPKGKPLQRGDKSQHDNDNNSNDNESNDKDNTDDNDSNDNDSDDNDSNDNDNEDDKDTQTTESKEEL